MKKTLFIYFFSFAIITANAQWVAQTSGISNPLTSTFFVTSNLGYCAVDNGAIIKTFNGGLSWTQVSAPHPPNGISQLIFTSIDTGFAVCGNGILKTTNGGSAWQNNFPDSNLVLTFNAHFPSKMVGYLTAANYMMDSAFLYKTIDGGNTWGIIYSEPDQALGNIYFLTPNIGFMSIGLDLYKTIDGGTTWNFLFANPPFFVAAFPSASIGYGIGELGAIYKTTDAGNNWTAQANSNTSTLYAASFINNDTGFVVGGDGFSSGMILKTTNGGANWSLALSISQTFFSIHFPNSSAGYACGQGGVIYKYSATTGINNNDEISGVTTFPNPNNGRFNLSVDQLNSSLTYKVSVLDLLGNTIQQIEMSKSSLDFDFSNQPKGIYFVKIENENGVVMKKIICQ